MKTRACGIVVGALLCAACPRDQNEAAPKAAEAPPAQAGAPVGSQAPDFSVTDEAGNTVALSHHRGKRPVLLAFYPMDFTAG